MESTHQPRVISETRAQFSVNYYQLLASDGSPTGVLPDFTANTDLLINFYTAMVRTRLFDTKAIALQRTGKMGTYPSSLGQEAIGVATGVAMQKNDVLIPYYRDLATQTIRGVSLVDTLLLWGGDERGNDFAESREDFPCCVPIANQVTHGAGVATAIKIRNERRAVVTTCGDGATSRGDFAEALNLAGVWQLPLVCVVNNNQWAISVPRANQTAAETIAQKGLAAGIDCEQVDGCDVLAMYDALTRALKKAYDGKGATIIEAISYRLCDHTTADDATRYRPPQAVKTGWKNEPIKRFRNFLHHQGLWDESKEQALFQQCEKEIELAVEEYLNVEAQAPESMFDYLYEELPAALKEQRKHVMHKAKRGNS